MFTDNVRSMGAQIGSGANFKIIKAPVVKNHTKVGNQQVWKNLPCMCNKQCDHNKMALLSLGKEYDLKRIRTARSAADSKSI
jgi:hypothetical protein